MSTISDIKERFDRAFDSKLEIVKKSLFGVNNERLDFFMDSFYKLTPQQRGIFVGTLIASIFSLVILAVIFYFVQVGALQDELNESFEALHRLKMMKREERMESQKFSALIDSISKKTKSIAFKPLFEKLTRDIKIEMTNLKEEKLDLESTNPMSSEVKQARISMKLPKISIPKLLEFLIEIEKTGKYLRINDLKITGLYGNKLYFDVQLIVKGYTVGK